MKALFVTIIVFAALFLGYDYFLAPVGTKVVFKSLNVAPPAPVQPVTAAPAEEKPVVIKPATPEPATPAPAPAAPVPGGPPPVAAAPATEASGFTPPKYEPVEVLTANWTKIPASAFPRAVKLTKDAEFKMGAGTAKMAAGGAAVALAFDNGNLTIAPTETSPARAVVPLDATDLKSILTAAYENWKPLRTDMLRKLHERKMAALKSQGVMLAPTGSLDAAGKPVRNPDGTYPVLLASMSSGQVTEVTRKNVHSWGEPTPAKIEGKDGWSIKVNYDASTIFGPMPVEAQALIFNGRVKGWYYTGSGEEVP
jgi:hypothetical protein